MSDSFESAKLPIHRHQWERDCVVIFRTAGGVGECLLLFRQDFLRLFQIYPEGTSFFRFAFRSHIAVHRFSHFLNDCQPDA